MVFSKSLIQWYLRHKRDLPWRNTQNPYHIWLSEIMLQQTRVAQGLPYFIAFTEAFPTVFDLAAAPEAQVLKLWQGLGYYSRARNLHQTAQQVASELNGRFPDNYADLLKLKGIGAYTAAAIASFSYDEKVPVVDGNVYRVLSRYLDLETDIASSRARTIFSEAALSLMDDASPALFNQAIMEFGALQCVPRNPDCGVCVLRESCAALQKGTVDQRPVKLKKTAVRSRFFNYLVAKDDAGRTLAIRRDGRGIWHGLYEFPLWETESPADFEKVSDYLSDNGFFGANIVSVSASPVREILHKLTHQTLHIRFWEVRVAGILTNGIDADTLKSLPFPVAICNFIEDDFTA